MTIKHLSRLTNSIIRKRTAIKGKTAIKWHGLTAVHGKQCNNSSAVEDKPARDRAKAVDPASSWPPLDGQLFARNHDNSGLNGQVGHFPKGTVYSSDDP
ncbi:hypothetical protein K0M31_012041 [Melipona bicolor]|uniref:Uncharacterized protein n=1 Tax=Melipona bicolor TaxID=60889 RepID=A0AA40GAZ5_9HYME|nr:hypothetical protein K0M31_012041 [Melipona bicolor]